MAPFAVRVELRDVPDFGGWAVQVLPPEPSMASVEVLVPAGLGDECIIAAGAGNAFMYTNDDLAEIIESALPVVQAAAYGGLQTAGETLYLLGQRGWSARGGMTPFPRVLRRRSRYEPYPAADPPPSVRDLVRTTVALLLDRYEADAEESFDDHGCVLRIRPADPRAVEIVVHAGRDDAGSWSTVELLDDVGVEGPGVLGDGVDHSRWMIYDWGDEGEIAAGLLALLTQIAAGHVEVATDGVGTVWVARGGRRQALGPQVRRSHRRRPRHTLPAWASRRS